MQRTRRKAAQSELSLRPARRQREVIRDVMLSAGECATWLTLEELARLTHYPPASISAQLRHLRKREFGAFAVLKRSRKVNRTMRGDGFGTLWEYTVARGQHAVARTPRERRRRKRTARRARNPRLRPRPRVSEGESTRA